MANILVFAESRGADLRKVAFEAVTAARALADQAGGEVHAIVFGAPGIAAKAGQLAKFGADGIFVAEHPGFATYAREAIAKTLADRAKASGYQTVLLAFTSQGRDLGPRIAAKLDAPIASDVISIEGARGTVKVKHPGYANKVIITLEITGSPTVVSVRPGAFTPKETPRGEK